MFQVIELDIGRVLLEASEASKRAGVYNHILALVIVHLCKKVAFHMIEIHGGFVLPMSSQKGALLPDGR